MKLITTLALVALALPASAQAWYADPVDLRNAGQETVEVVILEAPPAPEPVTEEVTDRPVTGEEDVEMAPQLDGAIEPQGRQQPNAIPSGSSSAATGPSSEPVVLERPPVPVVPPLVSPSRPAVPEIPAQYVNVKRPGIPCTRYSLRHCAPGEVPLW